MQEAWQAGESSASYAPQAEPGLPLSAAELALRKRALALCAGGQAV